MRSSPALDEALEWLEIYGGGKYFVKPLSPGEMQARLLRIRGTQRRDHFGWKSIKSMLKA